MSGNQYKKILNYFEFFFLWLDSFTSALNCKHLTNCSVVSGTTSNSFTELYFWAKVIFK